MIVESGLHTAHDEKNAYPGKRDGRQLLEELLRMSDADAVGLGGIVEGLAFTEQAIPSLLLAPGAHDSHGRSDSLLYSGIERTRIARISASMNVGCG